MGLDHKKSDRVFSSSSFSSSYYLLILSPLLDPQDQIQAALGGGAGRDADGRDQGRRGEEGRCCHGPWEMSLGVRWEEETDRCVEERMRKEKRNES